MKHALLIFCVCAAACGAAATPTAPSPPPPASIVGNWSGTFTYTPFTGGTRLVSATTATFTQAGANITGQINTQFTDRTAGTITGTVTSNTLQGTMQFSNNTGCNGTAAVSGTISGGSVRWSIPSVASTNCNWFTNVDIVLAR